MPLTDIAIRNAKAKDKAYKHTRHLIRPDMLELRVVLLFGQELAQERNNHRTAQQPFRQIVAGWIMIPDHDWHRGAAEGNRLLSVGE